MKCFFLSYEDLIRIVGQRQKILQRLRDVALYKLVIMNMHLNQFDNNLVRLVRHIESLKSKNKQVNKKEKLKEKELQHEVDDFFLNSPIQSDRNINQEQKQKFVGHILRKEQTKSGALSTKAEDKSPIITLNDEESKIAGFQFMEKRGHSKPLIEEPSAPKNIDAFHKQPVATVIKNRREDYEIIVPDEMVSGVALPNSQAKHSMTSIPTSNNLITDPDEEDEKSNQIDEKTEEISMPNFTVHENKMGFVYGLKQKSTEKLKPNPDSTGLLKTVSKGRKNMPKPTLAIDLQLELPSHHSSYHSSTLPQAYADEESNAGSYAIENERNEDEVLQFEGGGVRVEEMKAGDEDEVDDEEKRIEDKGKLLKHYFSLNSASVKRLLMKMSGNESSAINVPASMLGLNSEMNKQVLNHMSTYQFKHEDFEACLIEYLNEKDISEIEPNTNLDNVPKKVAESFRSIPAHKQFNRKYSRFLMVGEHSIQSMDYPIECFDANYDHARRSGLKMTFAEDLDSKHKFIDAEELNVSAPIIVIDDIDIPNMNISKVEETVELLEVSIWRVTIRENTSTCTTTTNECSRRWSKTSLR